MAKQNKSISFYKARFDITDKYDIKIVEETKDGENVYPLNDVIEAWSGLDGLTIDIKLSKDV